MEEFIIHNRDKIFFEMLSDEKIMKSIADIPVKCDELILLENKSDKNKRHWKANTFKIFFAAVIIAGLVSLFLWFVLQHIAVMFKSSEFQWSWFLQIRQLCVLLVFLFTLIFGLIVGFESYFETIKIMTLKEQIQFVQLAAALNDRLVPSSEDYNYAEEKYCEKHAKITWLLSNEAEKSKLLSSVSEKLQNR